LRSGRSVGGSMRVWLVAATLVLTATAAEAAALEYDLIWTTFARETRWAGDEKRPVAAGERSGRALARLTRIRPGVLRLEWRGDAAGGAAGLLARLVDALDGGGDAPGQLAGRERLQHDALHAGLGRLAHDLAGAVRGDHHHAQSRAQHPRPLNELEPVQLGHLV